MGYKKETTIGRHQLGTDVYQAWGEKMETSHQKSSWKFKGEVPVPACFSCYARLRDADVFDPDEDARFAVVGGRLLLHLDKQHQLWEYEQNGDRWVQLAESTGNRTLAHIETTDEFMYSVVPVGDERIALISNGLVIEVVLGEGTADVQPRHGCAGVVREGSRHGPREAGPMFVRTCVLTFCSNCLLMFGKL